MAIAKPSLLVAITICLKFALAAPLQNETSCKISMCVSDSSGMNDCPNDSTNTTTYDSGSGNCNNSGSDNCNNSGSGNCNNSGSGNFNNSGSDCCNGSLPDNCYWDFPCDSGSDISSSDYCNGCYPADWPYDCDFMFGNLSGSGCDCLSNSLNKVIFCPNNQLISMKTTTITICKQTVEGSMICQMNNEGRLPCYCNQECEKYIGWYDVESPVPINCSGVENPETPNNTCNCTCKPPPCPSGGDGSDCTCSDG